MDEMLTWAACPTHVYPRLVLSLVPGGIVPWFAAPQSEHLNMERELQRFRSLALQTGRDLAKGKAKP